MNDIPQVVGYSDSGEIGVKIICPFCGELHSHGRGELDATGNLGHRISHCLLNNDNPGYEIIDVKPLAELTKSSIAMCRKAERRNLRIWRRGG